MTTVGHQFLSHKPHGMDLHKGLVLVLLPVQQLPHCYFGRGGYGGAFTLGGKVGFQVPQLHHLPTIVGAVDQQRADNIHHKR